MVECGLQLEAVDRESTPASVSKAKSSLASMPKAAPIFESLCLGVLVVHLQSTRL